MLLVKVFEELDVWIDEQNRAARNESMIEYRRCLFRIVEQSALINVELDFDVAATGDLDAYTDAQYAVLKKLEEILAKHGLKYDLLSSEIWMPAETEYIDVFLGDWVRTQRAGVEYVMASKAKKSPGKNATLLQNYIASEPSDLFFKLCEKYEIDLAKIVEGKI